MKSFACSSSGMMRVKMTKAFRKSSTVPEDFANFGRPADRSAVTPFCPQSLFGLNRHESPFIPDTGDAQGHHKESTKIFRGLKCKKPTTVK